MPKELRTVEQERGSVTRSIHAAFELNRASVIHSNGREILDLSLPVGLITTGKVSYSLGNDFPSLSESDMRIRLIRSGASDVNEFTAVKVDVFPHDLVSPWRMGFELDPFDQTKKYQMGKSGVADRGVVEDFPRILEYAGYLQKLWGLLKEAGITEEADIARAEHALLVAEIHHRGVKRADGTPFIDHVFEVAKILVKEFGVKDVKEIVIGLCHDVLEDSLYWQQEEADGEKEASEGHDDWKIRATGLLAHEIGREEAIEIANLSRPRRDNIKIFSDKVADHMYRQVLNRKIKMADRLHNLRTLGSVSKRRQMDTLVSTYDDYFPMLAEGLYEPENREVTLYGLRELWKEVEGWAPAHGLPFKTPYWAKSDFRIEDLRQPEI